MPTSTASSFACASHFVIAQLPEQTFRRLSFVRLAACPAIVLRRIGQLAASAALGLICVAWLPCV